MNYDFISMMKLDTFIVEVHNLTISLFTGIPIDKVASMDQQTRNYVGKKFLELTLMELFVFRFMQAISSFIFSFCPLS